jgi:hypothetical protein
MRRQRQRSQDKQRIAEMRAKKERPPERPVLRHVFEQHQPGKSNVCWAKMRASPMGLKLSTRSEAPVLTGVREDHVVEFHSVFAFDHFATDFYRFSHLSLRHLRVGDFRGLTLIVDEDNVSALVFAGRITS